MFKMKTRSLLLAVMVALSLGACSTTENLKPLPPDPALQARAQHVAPMAGLDARGMTYQGPLPQYVAPISEKTDFLGDVTMVDVQSAIRALNAHGQNGEQRIRHHIPMVVRACGRVTLQQVALEELRRQTDHVEEYQKRAQNTRSITEPLGYLAQAGGLASAFASYTSSYGLTYLLGNFIPSVSDRYMYSTILDRDDVSVALHMAQSRFWYNDNDIWLDTMSTFCPVFMNWIEEHGGALVPANDRYEEPVYSAPGDPLSAQAPTPSEPASKPRYRHR